MIGLFLPYPGRPLPARCWTLGRHLRAALPQHGSPSAWGAASARGDAGGKWRPQYGAPRGTANPPLPACAALRLRLPSNECVRHGTLPRRPNVAKPQIMRCSAGDSRPFPSSLFSLAPVPGVAHGMSRHGVRPAATPCTPLKSLQMPITLYIINDSSESPGTSDSPPPACTTLRPCLRDPASEQVKNHVLKVTVAGALLAIRQVRQMRIDVQ